MEPPLTARAATVAALLISGLLLVAAGCGASDDETGRLDGSSWRLTGWSLSSLSPAGFTISAAFRDGSVAGRAAVNHYSAPYETGPAGAFAVGAVISTKMAGPEPAMRVETAYLTLLRQAASFSRRSDTLTLYDRGGNESLIFSAPRK